jgi:hypothetical protein
MSLAWDYADEERQSRLDRLWRREHPWLLRLYRLAAGAVAIGGWWLAVRLVIWRFLGW